ncbi:DUF5110 domain-containing protein [Natrinema sp. SYSU A 869]|uniref:DUF5110 domain-containing protein n=1 Tax=Natrinema sp. SYSU A 869 TaxID=2871694 RepID=UPI0021082D2A|nr:DUF5110 domain-containing protein [Natrinema sp. SYSU A 869]
MEPARLPRRDGSFELYEDAGDGYAYEDGEYAITPITWDEHAGELTIGDRDGSFPDLTEMREFRIVPVEKGAGIGVDEHNPQTTITYEGTKRPSSSTAITASRSPSVVLRDGAQTGGRSD